MTNTSVLSASEAVKFLEWLDPVGLHNLVAIDPVTKAVQALSFKMPITDSVIEWVDSRNGRMNLYFSINEPSAEAREDTKLRRDEISHIRAFHVDIDNLEGEPDWDMDCLPSAVIDSGGGRWGFWKLAAPYALDESDSVAAIEAQNRALTARFHGDGQAHNIDRIARLPGTLNIPNEAKRKKGRVETFSRILSLTGMTYEPAEVASWCPPLAVTPEKALQTANSADLGVELDTSANTAKAIKWLLNDAPEAELGNGSNGVTYQVAAKLKDFGISQTACLALMLDFWNDTKSTPPWPAHKLQTLIAHAYRYGTAAAGKLAPALAETEFDAVDIGETIPAPKPRKMNPVLFDAITQDLKAESRHLIQGWYDQATMIVTYGESNSGKTHVVLDQALAIAAGRPWAGCPTHAGLVVYVAAEGGYGLQRRVMAHRIFRPEHKNLPFALIPYPINLMHAAADAKELIARVKELESDTGQKCVMVVIDTLSRALAGGDENSSADMGAFVKRCDEIRAATGAALHVIHHAGKNTAKGARGHSLLRAAVDTEIEIEAGAILSRKQRDMEGAPELRFSYKPIDIGENLDGVMQTSVVLDVWAQTEFDLEMTPADREIWQLASAYVLREIQEIQKTLDDLAPKPTLRTVIVTPSEIGPMSVTELSEKTVQRAFGHLVEIGVMSKSKRGQYYLNRTDIGTLEGHSEMSATR